MAAAAHLRVKSGARCNSSRSRQICRHRDRSGPGCDGSLPECFHDAVSHPAMRCVSGNVIQAEINGDCSSASYEGNCHEREHHAWHMLPEIEVSKTLHHPSPSKTSSDERSVGKESVRTCKAQGTT